MKSKKNKSVNIKKYKRKRDLNLGIFLFAIVFIYLLVTVISYFSKENISMYEVREGSIVRDNSYTGLIIREETAVSAEAAGYVSYYQNENSKVKTGANIYALSPEALNLETAASEETESTAVSSDVQAGIALQLQSFNENYNPNDFSDIYSLKNEINTSLQDTYNVTRTQHLGTVIAGSGLEVVSYTAPRDGIVAFTVDGYEGITKDTFTEDDFATTEYENTVLSDQMEVSAGDPVYRLITSEEWSVIVPLDKETAESLQKDEISSIKVRID
ncbi:MAG TPA: hypothetical protein H9852_06045, partial [Candidatus Mediterraneibacter colneyensis]|nr:hypothetical protein [Candidatus Mediterraneibacter colneyensis]